MIARPELGQHLGGDRGQLDPGVLEHLFQPGDLGGPDVDLGLAVARQLPQLADRRRRHEAGPHHAVRGHVGQPLGIGHVRLAARDVLDVMRVAQPQLEAAFERVVDRLPVHPGRLHRGQADLALRQPAGHRGQPAGRGAEPRLLGLHAAARSRPAHAHRDLVPVHIQASDPVVDLFHVSSSDGFPRRPTGEDLVVNRIWGSCSQRQSQVPRVLHQTCCGLSALQYRDGDRARRAAEGISSLRGGRQVMRTCSTSTCPAGNGTP